MHVGQKLTPTITSKKYDLIIIGSGISGLTLANLQAKQGKSVLVLEKHYTAGGFTHTYQRKGFEWDSGLHYIGEVHGEKNAMRKVFDFISDGNLKWAHMPETYDRFIYPDKSYACKAGKEQFTEELLRNFSNERKAIEKYLKLTDSATGTLRKMTFAKTLPLPFSKLTRHFDNSELFYKSTYDVLKDLTKDEKLISVLTGQWGNYGLPPKKSSFGVHGVVARHYLNGGSFPVGGSSEVAKTIVKSIEDHGGKVVIATGVANILTRNNVAYGVLLENGSTVEGKKIVSSVGVHQTYLSLFKEEQLPSVMKDRIKRVKPSLSYMSLNIGIDEDSSILNHTGENLWVYPDYDHDKSFDGFLKNLSASPPMTYISFPSLKDPKWNERMPGKTTIDILGLAKYEWFENSQRKSEDYIKLKEQLVAPYFESLYKIFPQIKNKISHYEVSSPLTVKRYVNYRQGEIYGISLDTERYKEQWLRPQTPIKNFYLTGQDVMMNGVCGAMMAGVFTSTVMNPVDTITQLGFDSIF